jgi:3-methylfumaryl-CoA hydratase
VAYEEWIGSEEERSERILGSVVEAMAATLDLERSPQAGEALPPGWQWLFFNPVVRRNALGIDGHPRRGGFLPPIELPRRMWAGSRIRYLADLPVGAHATRRSRILKIENKAGKSGSLSFLTVEHIISCDGTPCISEEQDIRALRLHQHRSVTTQCRYGAAVSSPTRRSCFAFRR